MKNHELDTISTTMALLSNVADYQRSIEINARNKKHLREIFEFVISKPELSLLSTALNDYSSVTITGINSSEEMLGIDDHNEMDVLFTFAAFTVRVCWTIRDRYDVGTLINSARTEIIFHKLTTSELSAISEAFEQCKYAIAVEISHPLGSKIQDTPQTPELDQDRYNLAKSFLSTLTKDSHYYRAEVVIRSSMDTYNVVYFVEAGNPKEAQVYVMNYLIQGERDIISIDDEYHSSCLQKAYESFECRPLSLFEFETYKSEHIVISKSMYRRPPCETIEGQRVQYLPENMQSILDISDLGKQKGNPTCYLDCSNLGTQRPLNDNDLKSLATSLKAPTNILSGKLLELSLEETATVTEFKVDSYIVQLPVFDYFEELFDVVENRAFTFEENHTMIIYLNDSTRLTEEVERFLGKVDAPIVVLYNGGFQH